MFRIAKLRIASKLREARPAVYVRGSTDFGARSMIAVRYESDCKVGQEEVAACRDRWKLKQIDKSRDVFDKEFEKERLCQVQKRRPTSNLQQART
jgi:hypothetical protein